MSQKDNQVQIDALSKWLGGSVLYKKESEIPFGASKDKVTVLMYFFRPAEVADRYFLLSRRALYETWLRCGLLRTVIVTNSACKLMQEFANDYSNVEIQEEPSLRPGDVNSISKDCNSRLFNRFATDYVLTVQDDGFPLRSGLEDFVGKYDFIGAPWRQRNWLGVSAGWVYKTWPMNGGFTLRSKKFCRAVSEYWKRYYADKTYVRSEQAEDVFCTMTLPRRFPEFFSSMRWPTSRTAADFSYEAALPMNFTPHPFGFHGAAAFCELMHLAKDGM